MTKTEKKLILKKQEQDLARVLWITLERWNLIPQRDNSGKNLKCPLLELGYKWKIPKESTKNICLGCVFTECVLYE